MPHDLLAIDKDSESIVARGGEIILEAARAVLRKDFPEVTERIALHVPDEKSRRVGQAVAAASLPEIRK